MANKFLGFIKFSLRSSKIIKGGFMSRTVIWLLGLLALGILIFLCVRNHTPDIQEDILTRTSSVLSAKSTEWVKVDVDGRNVTLTGVAPSESLRDNAVEIAGAVWGVVSVDNQLTITKPAPAVVIAPEPVIHSSYNTQFTKNASGIVLTGSVPNEEQHRILVQLAEEKFGVGHVTDQLQTRADAPEGWQQVATLAIPNLAFFDQGSAKLVDTNIDISGRVVDEQAKNTVTGMQKLLPQNFKGNFNVTVRQPVVEEVHQDTGLFCAEQFNKKLAGQVVHFSTDSVAVETQDQAVFDQILEFSSSCPNSIIEVAGHTDSRGVEVYNLWLSQQRAAAIMNKLIKRGMRKDRLKAKGYGESNPLSDNSSRKGQAKNRRIEFNYLQEGE